MMWLLIATLCLQTSATDAECRREVRGPYPSTQECLERVRPTAAVLKEIAADLGAPVPFVSIHCARGMGG